MDFAEDVLIPVLALLLLFGTVFGITLVWLRTRNQQRLALIEKGHGAGLVDRERGASLSVRWALFLAGAGCGLLAGELLARYTIVSGWVAYLSMLLLGAGAGLLLGNPGIRRVSS